MNQKQKNTLAAFTVLLMILAPLCAFAQEKPGGPGPGGPRGGGGGNPPGKIGGPGAGPQFGGGNPPGQMGGPGRGPQFGGGGGGQFGQQQGFGGNPPGPTGGPGMGQQFGGPGMNQQQGGEQPGLKRFPPPGAPGTEQQGESGSENASGPQEGFRPKPKWGNDPNFRPNPPGPVGGKGEGMRKDLPKRFGETARNSTGEPTGKPAWLDNNPLTAPNQETANQ